MRGITPIPDPQLCFCLLPSPPCFRSLPTYFSGPFSPLGEKVRMRGISPHPIPLPKRGEGILDRNGERGKQAKGERKQQAKGDRKTKRTARKSRVERVGKQAEKRKAGERGDDHGGGGRLAPPSLAPKSSTEASPCKGQALTFPGGRELLAAHDDGGFFRQRAEIIRCAGFSGCSRR